MSGPSDFIAVDQNGSYELLPLAMTRTPPLVVVDLPEITGTIAPGNTVTRVAGNYTGPTITARSYRWEQRDLNGLDVTTAPDGNTTYAIPAASPTGTLRLFETLSTDTGSIDIASVIETITASSSVPVFSSHPIIAGTGIVGTAITVTPGTATGTPAPTLANELQRDGVAMPTTGVSYTIVAGDVGDVFRWRTKATNSAAPSGVYSNYTASITARVAGGAITWPAIAGTGTGAGQARSKALPYYTTDKNGAGNMSYFGPAMVATAYDSWRGNTATDTYTVNCIKNCLGGGRDPSMSMGYPAQHQMYFGIAVWFVTQIPRLWTGTGTFSASEKTRIDLLMKCGGIAGATCSRDAGDGGGNAYSLLGWNNPSNPSDNPNFRTASRAWPFILSAYLGSTTAGKAYLDAVTTTVLNTMYTNLVANGLSNAAAAFNPNRPNAEGPAPTYATIVNKCTDWTTTGGYSLLQPTQVLAAELNNAFDKTVTTGYNNGAGTPDSGGTRGKFAGSVAGNAEYAAIAGDVGRCHEYESGDAEGQRSSASYAAWACWCEFGFALICIASGMVVPDAAGIPGAVAKMKVGIRYQRLASSIGYLSWAHNGGNGSQTYDSNDSDQWGITYRNSLGDVVVGAVESV